MVVLGTAASAPLKVCRERKKYWGPGARFAGAVEFRLHLAARVGVRIRRHGRCEHLSDLGIQRRRFVLALADLQGFGGNVHAQQSGSERRRHAPAMPAFTVVSGTCKFALQQVDGIHALDAAAQPG